MVTLAGWVAAATGLYRMVAPEAGQLGEGLMTDMLFLGLALLGAYLTGTGYWGRTPDAPDLAG